MLQLGGGAPPFFWKIGKKRNLEAPTGAVHPVGHSVALPISSGTPDFGVFLLLLCGLEALPMSPMPGGLCPGGEGWSKGPPDFLENCSKGKENPWIWGEAGGMSNPKPPKTVTGGPALPPHFGGVSVSPSQNAPRGKKDEFGPSHFCALNSLSGPAGVLGRGPKFWGPPRMTLQEGFWLC